MVSLFITNLFAALAYEFLLLLSVSLWKTLGEYCRLNIINADRVPKMPGVWAAFRRSCFWVYHSFQVQFLSPRCFWLFSPLECIRGILIYILRACLRDNYPWFLLGVPICHPQSWILIHLKVGIRAQIHRLERWRLWEVGALGGNSGLWIIGWSELVHKTLGLL